MSDQNLTERGRGVAILGLTKGVHESFHRDTHWTLEKREGDVYGFIVDRRAEAQHIALGGRRWSMDEGEVARLIDSLSVIQLWTAGLPRDLPVLWTPDKIIDAALHRLFHSEVDPREVIEAEGNLLVTVGITVLLNLLKGDADTTFSNANARLGVGDSSTAAAVGQTDLQAATNKLRKAMNATYPIDTAPTIDFQSTFGSAEANFAWNEVGTFNAASGATMLNRVVTALGTKTSGATWTLTETVTWS